MDYVIRINIQFLLLLYINRHTYVINFYMPINLFYHPLCPVPSLSVEILVLHCLSRAPAVCFPLLWDSYAFCLWPACLVSDLCLLSLWELRGSAFPVSAWFLTNTLLSPALGL